ncbi:MAG: helix-turn-helix domain-containing protein, partial [Clostridia bacterium]|nr:helix-turn-helix domain-containing protein [Clostridia bacterium]
MIKELREKSGLSQQDFAEKYNIPVCTLRQWEQQRRKAPDYVYSLLKTVVNEDLSKANSKEPLNHAPINSW